MASIIQQHLRETRDDILYDPGKQRDVIDRYLAEAIPAFESAVRSVNRDDLLTAVGTGLIQCIFNMKHPAFCGEDEWRILLLESHGNVAFPVKYRSSNSNIVPYLELPFQHDWVSTVVSGPMIPRDPNGWAISRLLATNHFTKATWESSGIALRA